nr:hypothetical protein Q903MT_gene1021 [Picea sitchensis]
MTYLFNASNSERWLQQHRLPIELLDRFPDSIHRNHTCSKDGQIRWYHYDYMFRTSLAQDTIQSYLLLQTKSLYLLVPATHL